MFAGLSVLAALTFLACGGDKPQPKTATVTPGGTKDQSLWPADDKSLCNQALNWRNSVEFDLQETSGPGALKPNVRRIYRTIGEGDQRKHIVVCREVDTNLDGIKDAMRTFNDKGEAKHEEVDSDYDGQVDTWINFVDGRLAEEQNDTNHDRKPDVWKVYQEGTVSRIKRDRNFDGKPDVWEIYVKGRLERMGVDETGDERIDRWDRDDLLRQQQEAEEQKKRDAEDAAKAASSQTKVEDDPAAADAGAPKAGAKDATKAKPKTATK